MLLKTRKKKSVSNKRSKNYQKALIESLKDPKEAAAYLEAALEEDDPKVILVALRNVVEAHGGMARVARKAKLNRESLYKTLSTKGNPKLSSLTTLLDAFDLRLSVNTK